MCKLLARLGASFVVGLTLLAVWLSTAPPAGAVPPWVGPVRTDGETLAWQYNYYDSTLYVQTAGAATPQDLGKGRYLGDVSGNLLVWSESAAPGFRLAGENLATAAPLTLPDPPGDDSAPILSGARLVWINHDPSDAATPWKIMTVDLAAGGAPSVVAGAPSSVLQPRQPVVSGDRVAWVVNYGTPGGSIDHWELWTTRIGAPATLVDSGPGEYYFHYDLGGTKLVYERDGGVRLVDVSDLSTNRLLAAAGTSPTTDGRYVFWQDSIDATTGESAIRGYDMATDSSFVALAASDTAFLTPWARGGALAYVVNHPHYYAYTVKLDRISDLLPSAPRPDPGTIGSDWFYFPETQHYLSFGFKSFWQHSGGLPVFGFPLTEEFTQHGYTVQYLERQRFEYHPEFAGTPYETELGLLGSEDAARRGLLGTPPFQPVDATIASTDCRLETATHHSVCGTFLAYWQSHGLDFGDPGTSYRESLALFGYPISEPFTDPATGLTTQYFERAVFEYHPGNPPAWQVELRLLGSAQLQAAGWK